MKCDEMFGPFNTHGEEEKCVQYFIRIPERRSGRREDTIECNSMTGFSWLKMVFSGLEFYDQLFEGHRCLESSEEFRFGLPHIFF
jgi:hypothetical protein